jgi:ketosteroid isomerase-like protein
MHADRAVIHEALRAVAARYAAAVDRRDCGLLRSAFTDDAVLLVPTSAGKRGEIELRGHDEIVTIIELLSRYPRTFHFLGQARFDVSVAATSGELYCIAHHITQGGDRDLVMYIRYQDVYRPDNGGDWLIARREVQVDWTETRPLEWPKEMKL